jgi:DNA-binding SARP family transcriptional activator/tetratricopeptide (TPR) repeat protein
MTDPIHIRLCGPLSVDRMGSTLTGRDLGSRKARTLLALLAVERGRLVEVDRIADVLWGVQQPADPAANIATLVSRLRRTIGDGVISGRGRAYGLLDDGACIVDLDQVAALVGDATERFRRSEPALVAAACTKALEVVGLRGVLHDEPGADWSESARRDADDLRRQAWHLLAMASLVTGDDQTARRMATAAVELDPFDEQAHRDLMRALVADGKTSAALDTYVALATRLREELGTDPDAETAALQLAILRNGALPGEAPERAPRPSSSAVLAGREREIAMLENAWASGGTGTPQLVMVAGEPGIGKTRLLFEAASLAERTGGLALATRCHPAERSLFLQPLVDLFAPLLMGMSGPRIAELVGDSSEAWASLVPELRDTLGVLEVPRAAPDVERRRAYDAIAVCLRNLARKHPVLLAVDDLQDAGAATIDLLRYLVRHLAGSRVVLLGSVRTEGEAEVARLSDLAVRIELGPLSAAAVSALAAAAGLGEQGARVMARTSGHPLSVVETLRALATGDTGVPESLAEAVLARVGRLTDAGQVAAGAAAILGGRVDAPTLAGLLEDSEVATVLACEHLVRVRLLVPTGSCYEFANDLIRDVVLNALPVPLAHAYHRRAADLLADRPESMAEHASAVGDNERAAHGWLLAGKAAMRRSAVEDALGLFDRALEAAELSGHQGLPARILLARARAREAMTDYTGALEDVDRALLLARESGDRRLEMAALRARGNDAPVALRHPVADLSRDLMAGLELASALGDRTAQADFNGRLTVFEASRLQLSAALSRAERSLVRARASGSDDAVIHALDGLKTALAYLGDAAPLAAVVAELEPRLRRSHSTWLLQWTVFESAFVPASDGNWTASRQRVDEALALNEKSGYRAYAGYLRAYRGWLARLSGDIETALADGRHAVEETSSDHAWWYATAAGLYSGSLLEAGRLEEAADVAERGLAAAGPDSAEAYRLRCLAPAAAATHNDAILEAADRLVAGITAPPGAAWIVGSDVYLCLASAWSARGNDDRAAEVLAPLRAATSTHRWSAIHDSVRRGLVQNRSVRS